MCAAVRERKKHCQIHAHTLLHTCGIYFSYTSSFVTIHNRTMRYYYANVLRLATNQLVNNNKRDRKIYMYFLRFLSFFVTFLNIISKVKCVKC